MAGLLGRLGGAIKGLFGAGSGTPAPGADLQGGKLAAAPSPTITGQADPLDSGGVKLWKERIERSKEISTPYWHVADLLEQEYLGTVDAVAGPEREGQAQPANMAASFVHTVGPYLLPSELWPIVEQKLGGDEYREGAHLLQARLRDLYELSATHEAIWRASYDALFLAGYAHVGWMPRTSATVRAGEGKEAVELDVARRDGLPLVVEHDDPIITHISYRQIRKDPDAKSFNRCRWVGFVDTRLMRELQADDVANNPAGIYRDTQALREGGDDYDDRDSASARADAKTNTYTIYHAGRRRGEICVRVFAGPSYSEIRSHYIELGIAGFPIRQLALIDVARLEPASVMQFWYDQQTALNEFLAEMVERARQSKTIVLTPKSESDLKTRIENADGGSVLECQDPRSVQTVSLGGVAGDTYKVAEIQQGLMDRVSGISDFQRGVSGGYGDTATEVALKNQYTQGRLEKLQGSVSRFIGELSRDCAALLLRFQWEDVPVRVEEAPGRPRFATFNNQAVPPRIDAYGFTIDIGERVRSSPIIQQKRTEETLKIVSNPQLQQAAAAEGKLISVVAALEDHLEAIGNRDISRYVRDLPDPRQIAMEQMQVAADETQAMLAGQPVEVNPMNDDHQAHATVHLEAADQSPLIAEHLAMHYAYLEAMGGTGGGAQPLRAMGGGMPPGGSSAPAPAMPSAGGRQSMGAQGTAQLMGQAMEVA